MRTYLKHFGLVLVTLLTIASTGTAQTAGGADEGLRLDANTNNGTLALSWWGKHGRVYLPEGSEDLVVWTALPAVEVGLDATLSYGFSTNASRYFLRLRKSDETDFDHDGLSNFEELAVGTNPVLADSDGDGISDGWELAHGLDPANPADAASIPAGGSQSYLTLYLAERGLLDRAAAAALPAGMQLVLRTPANEFKGVTSAGVISPVSPP